MPSNTTKEKHKLKKPFVKDEIADSEEAEHELSYYLDDRVKLMKEVIKIITPKKIKSLAPECIKGLRIEEINSMLLEELLGISNKRLKYIFNGENLDEDSSSTDEENKPIDTISLDEISDNDFVVIDSDNDTPRKKGSRRKIKKENEVCVKKEKNGKDKRKSKDKNKIKGVASNDNLMSVLELLELQARARAIKSQLVLENKKAEDASKLEPVEILSDNDNDDEIIIEEPKLDEIVINSSDSEAEPEQSKEKSISLENGIPETTLEINDNENANNEKTVRRKSIESDVEPIKRVKLIQSIQLDVPSSEDTPNKNIDGATISPISLPELSKNDASKTVEDDEILKANNVLNTTPEKSKAEESDKQVNKTQIDTDEIVINLGEEEINDFINK